MSVSLVLLHVHASYVVVGIPSGEVRAEHEVVAVLLQDGWGFDLLAPLVHVACHTEVVGRERINPQTVWSLYTLVFGLHDTN